MRRALRPLVLVLLLVAAGAYYYYYVRAHPDHLMLTGLVTTEDVVVGARVAGELRQLAVREGDTVAAGQLLGTIAPDELRADRTYFEQAAHGATSQVAQSEAALKFEEEQTASQVRQAQAALAAAEAAKQSAEADLEHARLTFERNGRLVEQGVIAREEYDRSRTAFAAIQAHVASLARQVDSARAAVALAENNAGQVAVRRGQLAASRFESAAAAAQREKADVRLAYTEIRAPRAGLVDVRAAREGEVVSVGQPIVTLVDPDDYWVRVDVEESYVDRLRIGDTLTVRLPSGIERPGTVIYRGADAGFATQRDVSRTKRDIRTFEVRLRVDNQDRRLALGMTAWVLLPLGD